MTGNELSQVLFSIILSYYGSRGHRPRWIAVGVIFSALSCFVLASPHIFYGPGNDALSLTEEVGHRVDSSGSFITDHTPTPFNNIETSSYPTSNYTGFNVPTSSNGAGKYSENLVIVTFLEFTGKVLCRIFIGSSFLKKIS